MVQETVDFFRSTVEPYFENLSRRQNYNNMVSSPDFKEKILYTDSDAEVGFILFEEKVENCSCSTKHIKAVSVLKKKEVLSLRDLSHDDIPLLQNMQEKCLAELAKIYSISPSKLESYVLYPPSHFPFHVVFETMDKDSPIPVEKAHHVDTIITNLNLIPDYYQKVSLNYSLFENDSLYKKYTCPDDGDS
ncbi:m7GpppX diphosphatase-like [Uloborus diversus]|nr:m7GpppX diphosphatase-like [Uloborus diversus]